MALPKVLEYTKNVSKSIVYSSAEALKNDMPSLSAYMTHEANRQLTKSIYAGVKDYKTTMKKARDYIVNNPFYEAGQDALKNAFDDIKTGKFYNKQRMDKAEEAVGGAMGWTMDDMGDDLDFDMDSGWGDDNGIDAGDKLVAASTQVSAMKAADMVSQTTLQSADAIIKTTKASTRLLYTQNVEMIGSLKQLGYTTAQTQGAIINLHDTLKVGVENSKTFFENTGKQMADISGMLKEMLEMQRNLYKANNEALEKRRQKEKEKLHYDDIVGYDGELNISNYFKNVSKNTKNAISQATGGMFDTLMTMGGGEALKMFTASPLSFLSTAIMKGITPAATRKAAKQLDKSIAGLASTIIARFNAAAANEDGTPFTKLLGNIFGVKTNIKSSFDTSQYNKGPVPFDGIVRKSIVDIIPTYLRRIEAALTGQQERIFNHANGKWTNMRAINEDWNNLKASSKRRATGDLVAEIRKVIDNDKSKLGSKYDVDRFDDALEAIMNRIYETGSFKKNRDDALALGIDPDTYEFIANIITNASGKKADMYKNQGMRNARMALANNVLSSRNELNKRIRQMEEDGDSVFFNLFNGSVDRSKLKIPKYEEAPMPMGGAMSLINQKDEKGHNVFWYLRNMYKELGIMRRAGGFGIGGDLASFDSSMYDFIIPDEHKKTNKERYYDSEEAVRRRYQELIERHSQKGGALYDLSRDAKGNIVLAEATQQQLNILEQLREEAETHGWLNDKLYGNSTMLTKLNEKRDKTGGDLLNQDKFMDRMKATKNLSEKLAVVQDQVKNLTRKPGEWVTKILKKADQGLYDLMFGYETEDESSPGEKVRGFLGVLQLKLNTTWDSINNAIEEKLINPLKKKLGVENMKDVLDKLGITPILDTFMNRVFGEKDADGKRQGGILGDTRDAIKNTFKRAGTFVSDSFKTVFDPITSRVKNAMNNKRATKAYVVDPVTGEEIEVDPSKPHINRKRNAPPRRATKKMYETNPEQAFNADKEFLHDVVTKYADIIQLDPDPNTNMYMILSYQDDINRVKKADDIARLRHIWYNTIQPQISSTIPIVLDNNVTSAWDRMTAYANKNATYKVILPHQVANQRAIDKSIGKHSGQQAGNFGPRKPGRVSSAANDMAKKFDEMFKFDRSDNGPGTQALAAIIKEMAVNGEGDAMEVLQNMTVGELYNATSGNVDTDGFAKFLSNKVKKEYNNRNIKVSDLLNGKTLDDLNTGSGGSGGMVRLLGNLNGILGNIFTHFKKITDGDTVRVVQSTPRYDGGVPFLNTPRGPRARSRRTRSSGGGGTPTVEGSADGGYFREDTISALSEGELYGQGGLFGKVPKTGLYNIKAGTTVIPTNKDKFIEKANEQDVISKLYRKAGIRMNADASNAETRTIDGKVYTRGEDGKWHHYEPTYGGKQIHTVVEDGFLDRIRDTVSSGTRGVMRRFGVEIPEKSGVDSVEDAMKVVKKYAPKMTASGLLGAAIGLFAGNPLLGAAIGASAGFVSASDKAKEVLFGNKIVDKDGNEDGRSGGIISREAQQWMKRNVPDMATYGTVGGILGLLTPFGLVGGAAIGAGIGLAKKSSAIQEALFGNEIDPRSGLISKNARDYLKKAAPNLALGAGAGLLLGPFGIMGNLALGAGIGLLSTTDDFKNAIFGEEVEVNGKKTRVGGLVGAIKITVVDPLKAFATSFANTMEDFIVKDVINPLKDAVKPIFRELKLLSNSAIKKIIGIFTGTFERAFGRPLFALFRDRLLLPIEKRMGGILGFAGGIARGIVGAPFHALGAIGNSLQMKHIRKGDASDMTAEERLQFRRDHKVRGAISNLPIVGNMFGSLGFNPRGYKDKYKDIDTLLAGMDEEQLKDIARDTEVLSSTPGKLRRKRIASSREIVRKLSEFFDSRDVARISKAMKSKNIKLVNQLILSAKPIRGTQVSNEQRAELTQEVMVAMREIDDIERRQNKAKWNADDMYKKLRDSGFKGINSKNIGKISRMAKTEYSARHYANLNKPADPSDPNASLINSGNSNTQMVVNTLNEGFESIKDILTAILPEGKKSKAMKTRSQEFFKRNTAYAYDKNAPTAMRNGKKYIKCKDGKWRVFNTDPATGRISIEETVDSLGDQDKSDEEFQDESEGEPDDNANAPEGGKKKRRNPIKWIYDSGANAIRKYRMSKSGDYEEVNGRAKQNADRKEEENEKKKLNLFGNMWKLFFGEKNEETGEKEKGIIGKAFDGMKSLAGKFFGKLFKGFAIVTAIAGAGHFAKFVQDEAFPKLKGWWNDSLKPFLKEHFTGFYNGIMSVAGFLKDLPGNIFNFGKDIFHWVSGTGNYKGQGFPQVFSTKILPWYMEGIGVFSERYLPALTKAVISAFPSIVLGISKGIGMAIKEWWNNRGSGKRASYKFVQKRTSSSSLFGNAIENKGNGLSGISPVSGGTAWWKTPGESINSVLDKMDSEIDSITSDDDSSYSGGVYEGGGVLGLEESERQKIKETNQAIINSKSASKEEKQKAIENMIANAEEPGGRYNPDYMPKDSKGNSYDKDGNVSNNNAHNLFNPFDGVTSWQERIAGYAFRTLLLGNRGKGLNIATKMAGTALGKLGPIAAVLAPGGIAGSLAAKLALGGSGVAANVANKGLNIFDSLSNNVGINEKIFGDAGTIGGLLKYGGGALSRKFDGTKFGDMMGRLSNSAIANEGLDKVFKDKLMKAGKATGSYLNDATDSVIDIVNPGDKEKQGLIKTFTDGVKKIFGKLFGRGGVVSKLVAKFKGTSTDVVDEVVLESGEKISNSIIKKVGDKLKSLVGDAYAKIAGIIGSIPLISVIESSVDFAMGVKNARDILSLTEEQPISIPEQIVAGVLNVLSGRIFRGLIPASLYVDIVIDGIAPMFGDGAFADLRERRKKSLETLEAYATQTGVDYTIEEFNHRNSLMNKFRAAIGLKSEAEIRKEIKEADGEEGLGVYDKLSKFGFAGKLIYDHKRKMDEVKSKGITDPAYSKLGPAYQAAMNGSLSTDYGTGRMFQGDPSIGNIPFNKPSDHIMQNVRNSGCGPVAAYNAVNYAYGRGGNDIEAAVNLALDKYKEQDGGTQPGFFKEYFRANGLSSRRLTGRNAILSNVSRGNPVIMMGRDPAGGNTPYGVNPHYVTATGTDGKGNIIIDDPESMYGQAKYPISKVLGRTSIAIGTSRYGRAIDPFTGEEIIEEQVYDGATITTTEGNTSKRNLNLAKSSAFMRFKGASLMSNVQNNINGSLTLKDKPLSTQHYICFTYCGYKDKTFGWLKTGNANLADRLAKYIEPTSLGARDYSSMTIGSIFTKLGFDLAKYYNTANVIAKYSDISCEEMRHQSSAAWSSFNYYASDFGFDIRGADKNTLVGSIASSMGITFDEESVNSTLNNTNAENSSSSGGLLYDTAAMNMELGNTQSGGNESIFSKLGKLVRSLFSYTDRKTGEQRNLLDFFGIGGGASSSSTSSISGSAGGVAQLTGVTGNMANGFPYFSQSDPAWGSIGYGNSGTIASSGCGPTSMAMILKSFGADSITPKDTAAWSVSNNYRIPGSGTSWDYFKAIGKQYGLTTEQSGEDQNKIVSSLRKGYPIITSMRPGDFTKRGHFIVLSGIDKDGNILVNDPSGSAGAKRSAIAWDPANITRQAKQMWVFNKGGVGSINGTQSASGVNTLGTSTTLKGNSVAEQIWNFLKSKGYNDIAAAGIMGNIAQECSYDPSKVEAKPKNDNPGLGICQWTYHTRKNKFLQMVPDWKTNLPGQLDFMWMEINSGFQKCKPESMNNCTSLEESVTLFHNVYEQSADATLTRRINFAQEAFANFAGKDNSGSTTLASNTNNVFVGMGKNPIKGFIKNNYGIGYLKSSYGRSVVPGGYVSSTFNDPTRYSHNGVDIAGAIGSPVLSPVSGVVYRVDDNSINGKLVVVRDYDGKLHTFSHMKSINVTEGARVSPGTLLGYLGNSGVSAGPHVHYSTTDKNGQYVDPLGSGKVAANKRPIGGSDGLDYTVLIKAVISLLEMMSKSSTETNAILKIISDKIGVDISSAKSSSDRVYSDIASKLKALDSTNNGTSPRPNQTETQRLVNIMTAIARD